MEIKIRNIPEDQLLRIDYKAKKKGISREEYIRQLIQYKAEEDELVLLQSFPKNLF